MKKIGKTIYNKLLLQAEEAKHRDMDELSNNVLSSIGSYPEDSKENYNPSEYENDIRSLLWKSAMNTIKYHDVKSADIIELQDTINYLSDKVIKELRATLKVKTNIGSFEEKLPGEE